MLAALLCGGFAGLLVCFPAQAALSALDGLALFARAVAPSLFPLYACMLLWQNALSRPLPQIPLVALGLLCGAPCSYALAAQNGTMRPRRTLCMLSTMSPMFFLSVLEAWLPGQGAVMLCAHALSAILCGCLIKETPVKNASRAKERLAVSEVLGRAVHAMLNVCACIVLCCVLRALLQCALPFLGEYARCALSCLLEVTGGTQLLSQTALPLALRARLCCAACSLGGLSLVLQTLPHARALGVKPRALIVMRVCHACASYALCACLQAALTIL